MANTWPSIEAAYIDPNLKPSTPTVTPVTYVGTNLADYDRSVFRTKGGPFFFNGIQLRADKVRGVSQSAIKSMYQTTTDDGFTVVNTQVLWSDIQPDKSFNATESTYIRGGTYASQNFVSSTSDLIRYHYGEESNKALTYVKFDFSSYSGTVDAAKVRFYVDSAALPFPFFSVKLYGITNNSWSSSSLT